MKLYKAAFITLVFILSYDIAWSQLQNSAAWNQLIEAERKAYEHKQRPSLSLAQNNYNIIYTRCSWQVNPAVRYIQGDVTTYFKPETAGFSNMEFDLSSELTVDSVLYHGAKLSFTHNSRHLVKINLPSVISVGLSDSITLFYQGEPTASFSQSTHSNEPIVWTLSEPYGPRDWWPCKQNLVDKIDSIDIIVTCPQQYKAASNGLLVSETVSGSKKTAHWKSRYPITTYLVAIAVTNYAEFTQVLTVPSGTLPILNYVYPENLANAINESAGIIEIMQLFDSLLIPYPFSKEKYGHAQFGWGGGMEHQTMSFMYSFDYGLMAHEVAHQWFGDHVTCGSWQEIWLNEGFATYFEGLAQQRYRPAIWEIWKTSKLKYITSQDDGMVFCVDTTNNIRTFDSRLSYDKGAYILRMLRWKIGTKAFFDGLKNYLTDPKIAGKFGKTSYLKEHLEATSGKSLTKFFDQWYYSEGFPSYVVEWKQVSNTLTVTIDQRTSHHSVSFFEMPVPIQFGNGNTDTIVVFDNTFAGQQFTCTLPFAANWAMIDPELQLLSKNNQVAVLYDLSSDPDLIKIYPNPAETKLEVKMMIDAERISDISIIDMLGKTLLNPLITVSQSTYEFDVTELPQAMYYIQVKTSRKTYRMKFVKQ